ncbi:unnamed protein product, partial [Didymodactylos carnosus]
MNTTGSSSQSELRPPFTTGEFVLNNFTAFLHEQTHAPIYSAPLRANNEIWRLRISTNASRTHLSAYTWLITSGVNSKYDFSIEMVNQRNSLKKNHLLKTFGHVFTTSRYAGWPDFYPLNRLIVDGFLVNDQIKFRYQVRPSSYFELYKTSTRQLRELQNENEQLREDVDEKVMANQVLQEEIAEKERTNEELQDQLERKDNEYEMLLEEKREENKSLHMKNEQLQKQFNDYKANLNLIKDKKKRTMSRKLWNDENDENEFSTLPSRSKKDRIILNNSG